MKVVIISSLAYSLTNFRGPLIKEMVREEHEVLACAPDRDETVIERLQSLGARFRLIPMGRANLNPLQDLITILAIVRLLRQEKPDVILAYTQKPIIYAGLA